MDREVYPNAPLALVACEIRVPSAGILPDSRQINELAKGFRDVLPVPNPLEQTSYTAGQAQASHQRTERFASRDHTSSIAFRPDAIVIQTSLYQGYIEHFRPLVKLALEVIGDVIGPQGTNRIGLRYFDEIRVPGVGDNPADWNSYFARPFVDVLALGEPLDLMPQAFQGVASFATRSGNILVLRWGPRDQPATDSQGVRRILPSTGPFFLIDIDSYWEATQETPPFDPKFILETCDDLHAPVRDLFESTITEDLRNVFREAD